MSANSAALTARYAKGRDETRVRVKVFDKHGAPTREILVPLAGEETLRDRRIAPKDRRRRRVPTERK